MKKVLHICDKCGKEEIFSEDSKSNYRKIKILIGERGSTYVSDDYRSSSKSIFLCNECLNKIGIDTDESKKIDFNKEPELIDKIYELFEIIADDLGYSKCD